jgi:hypothetical protein
MGVAADVGGHDELNRRSNNIILIESTQPLKQDLRILRRFFGINLNPPHYESH